MTSPALALVVALAASTQTYRYPSTTYVVVGSNIKQEELTEQQEAFQNLWEKDLVVRLEELPKEGRVPDYRIPYSGHDYPDKVGGTLGAMAKYDRAFHRGYSKAYQAERDDLAFHMTVKKPIGEEIVHRGRFGRIISVSSPRHVVPTWYGHCNGWTAASIRHAEPQRSVVRNGVTITPADIKGMLAELYMYSQTQFLGGVDDSVNPGTLHISLANWIGRQSHPIGMETALGDPVINFPIFAYKSTVTKISSRQYDVRMLITYTLHIAREMEKGPKAHRNLYFHYALNLDANGNITGGHYHGDSGRIDMLWTPLKPVQGGQDGNRGGNPHLNLEEVLSIYRESVDEALLKKWVNIDPTDMERELAERDLPARPKEDREDKPVEQDPAAVPAATDAVATPPATPPEEAAVADSAPAPAVATPEAASAPATPPPPPAAEPGSAAGESAPQ